MKNRHRSRLAWPVALLLLAACGGGGSDAPDAGNGATRRDTVLILQHEAVAYDETRQVYYATVSPTDTERGNRIVTLSPQGSVAATSEPIGSNPTALAVSRDGSRLYVALGGSAEILQYALPSFSLLGRLTLPMDSSRYQTFAEQIAVSPTDPNTIAVSLAYPSGSPRHAGVALVRDMNLLPDRTPTHTGSNRIGFDASGAAVYGFNNETTEFGLRRLAFTGTGIREAAVTPVAEADFSWDMHVSERLVLVGNKAFTVGTLAPRGVVAGASFHCVTTPSAARVACFSTDYGRLVVAEAQSFTRAGEVAFPETSATAAFTLVRGPSGQVVASAQASGRLYFINSELLR